MIICQECVNIECTIGILRAKWRLLGKNIEVGSKKATVIIKCMYILHNVVREKDGDSDLNYCNIMLVSENVWEDEITDQRARGVNALQRVKEIRNMFVDYFLSTYFFRYYIIVI